MSYGKVGGRTHTTLFDGASIGANSLPAMVHHVLGHSMSWYTSEHSALLLYSLPSSKFLLCRCYRRPHNASDLSLWQRAYPPHFQAIEESGGAFLLQLFGLSSTYLHSSAWYHCASSCHLQGHSTRYWILVSLSACEHMSFSWLFCSWPISRWVVSPSRYFFPFFLSSSLFWSYVSQVPFIGRHTGWASYRVDHGSHAINHDTFTTYSEALQKHWWSHESMCTPP